MKKHLFILYGIITLFGLNACLLLETDVQILSKQASFAYDPNTILEGIRRGERDVLIPLEPRQEPEYISGKALPVWSQAEVFEIVDYIFETVWRDSRDGWQVHYFSLHSSCQASQGFQVGRFIFVKVLSGEPHDTRLVRTIVIQRHLIATKDESYNPMQGSWDIFDLEEATVTAEQAIQIAEQEGGLQSRLAVDNDCVIYVEFAQVDEPLIPMLGFPAIESYKWYVRYSQDGQSIFRKLVDAR